MTFRLVPAKIEDEPWLDRLRREAYRDLFVATWGRWEEGRHQRHFAECMRRGGIHTIEWNGARVGMVQLLEHADAVEIGEIQVLPEHQGRGIGTAVIRDVVARAHAAGRKVTLATGRKNHRAQELYRRLGFERVARTKTHDHMECKPHSA